jgi:dephospho-CoA kinase
MAGKNHWTLGGGLASGKSKVRELLAHHGMATIDADQVGHQVLASFGPAFSDVADRWPHVVVDGEIDRRALANVVFNDGGELATLESLTHSHIFETIRAMVEGIEATVIVEVPLLAHRLGEDWKTIIVDCRDEIRLVRAVERGMTTEDARARIAAQPSRQQWLAAADVVIPNHDGPGELISTVGHLVPEL